MDTNIAQGIEAWITKVRGRLQGLTPFSPAWDAEMALLEELESAADDGPADLRSGAPSEVDQWT